jgi:hypothetical protein
MMSLDGKALFISIVLLASAANAHTLLLPKIHEKTLNLQDSLANFLTPFAHVHHFYSPSRPKALLQ